MNITNEKITEYINGFYRPLSKELSELRESAEKDRVPVILRDTEGLIISLLKTVKPKRLLEIGTAVGYSASCFAAAAERLEITSLESDPAMYNAAIKNIAALGFSERVNVIAGDARVTMRSLTAGYDIVFIDAAKGQYRVFWDSAIPLCKNGSIIVSDNVLMKGCAASDEYDPTGRFKTAIRKMREYLDYICSLDYADSVVLTVGDGVAISIIKNMNQEF